MFTFYIFAHHPAYSNVNSQSTRVSEKINTAKSRSTTTTNASRNYSILYRLHKNWARQINKYGRTISAWSQSTNQRKRQMRKYRWYHRNTYFYAGMKKTKLLETLVKNKNYLLLLKIYHIPYTLSSADISSPIYFWR